MIDKLHESGIADIPLHEAVIDALEARIVLLDGSGTILIVNAACRRFGEANGIRDRRFGVGADYFAVCNAALGPNARPPQRAFKTFRTAGGLPFIWSIPATVLTKNGGLRYARRRSRAMPVSWLLRTRTSQDE